MSTFDLENPKPLVGDSLRDETANLLSVRFGRPTREDLVMGKKVDLHFIKVEFGKTTHIFVETKDYAKPLTREQVKGIWADYSGLVDRHQPAFLLLVTRNGLASGAQAYVNAEQSNLRHQTIWELENETLGLADYVRHLAGLFDHDGLSQYYIESTGRRITYGADHVRHASDEAMRLFDELQLWIADDDRRPLAVLGGYGAGKTSLARRLVAMQAQTALADPLARRPVLIRLGELSRYAGIEGLLGGMFTFDFPVDGFNVRRFLDLNAKGRLLIVLDGFDEMKHAMSWADFRHQIADLNRFTGAAAKVVLLGRPSAFTSTDEHFHVLRGLKKWDGGYRRLPDWPDFIEYELSEFTREERSRFIAGYLAHRATHGPHAETGNRDWIARRVEEVDRLADADPDLFGKPVHAKILVDAELDAAIAAGEGMADHQPLHLVVEAGAALLGDDIGHADLDHALLLVRIDIGCHPDHAAVDRDGIGAIANIVDQLVEILVEIERIEGDAVDSPDVAILGAGRGQCAAMMLAEQRHQHMPVDQRRPQWIAHARRASMKCLRHNAT